MILHHLESSATTTVCQEDNPEFLEEKALLAEFDVLFPIPRITVPNDDEPDDVTEEIANKR